MRRTGGRHPATRPRPVLFDAGVEAPDLLDADRRARAAQAGPNRGGTMRDKAAKGAPEAKPRPAARRRRRVSATPAGTGGRRWGRRHRPAPEAEVRIATPRSGVRVESAGRRRGGPSSTAAKGAAAKGAAAKGAAANPPGGRRRRGLAAVTMAVMVLAGAGGLLLLSPLGGVRTVLVVGADRTGPAEVRAASGLGSAPPMVRVDEDQVTAKVAGLPWVARAGLERRWPRTVVLTVEERRPAAVAPCRAFVSCLVDAGGRVLAPASDEAEAAGALPRLTGVPEADEPGDELPEAARGPLAVAVALPPALRPLVLGVRGDGEEVVLDLQAPGRTSTPPVVRLGRPDRIPEKLTATATVLARTSVNGLELLDVRVPESPALTRLRR